MVMSSQPDARPVRPIRWKSWLVTAGGIYPVIVALVLIITPLTPSWPAPARLALIVPLAVATMTWIVGPALQRRLGGWMTRA